MKTFKDLKVGDIVYHVNYFIYDKDNVLNPVINNAEYTVKEVTNESITIECNNDSKTLYINNILDSMVYNGYMYIIATNKHAAIDAMKDIIQPIIDKLYSDVNLVRNVLSKFILKIIE